MTSHVVVVHSSARTVKIPTGPTKYLSEVRDEACKKFNISADQSTLRFNNKPISLSQQIRHTNLPQGARLELVQSSRSPTVISVALQLPESEKSVRLTRKFPSNISLWEILRQFESEPGKNYNFTQRGVPEMKSAGSSGAGRLHYEMPVITVMPGHREQASLVGLQQTLNQLGFDNGSALLKLSFRNSGTPLEEAMTEISQYFKSSEPAAGTTPAGAHSGTAAQSRSIPDPDKAAPDATRTIAGSSVGPEPAEPMDVDSETTDRSPSGSTEQKANPSPAPSASSNSTPAVAMSGSSSTSSSTGRNLQIFAPPSSSTPQAARRAWNEGDYVPTIEHAKAHQAVLQAKSRNQRLLSDKELAEQEQQRLEKLNQTAEKGGSLRIRMPDQSIIQTTITKADTADSLYTLVQDLLEFKDQPFLLKYIGPKGAHVALNRGGERLIQDLRFSEREIVTFVWDEKASAEARLSRKTLKQEWQDRAQALKVEEPVVNDTPEPANESKTEGKKKWGGGGGSSSADKESKLKSILGKGLFKR